MAITFVGSHVGTHASTSAQTVNFTSLRDESNNQPTLQQGDIVLVAVENASTVNRGAGALVPSGYSTIAGARYENDSNDSNFDVSYKFMGVTPDTSVDIPASNATTAGVAYAIYVFRGVATAFNDNGSSTLAGGTNTGVANAPSITPATAGAWIVVFGGAAVAAGAVFTNPAGMSGTTNHFRSATITSTTNDANIGGAIYTGWTSGSYDPAAFGGSTSTNTGSWSAFSMALKPIVSHATTGTLTGPGSTIAGSAERTGGAVTHATTGALTGQGSTVAGSAARTRAHATSGVLAGPGASLAGSAARTRQHATSGGLQGPGSAVAGAAARTRQHGTSGALAGQGADLDGAAARTRHHATNGALAGPGADIAGSAERAGGAVSHATSAALTGQGSTVAGSAARTRAHAASGALAGSGTQIIAAAHRFRAHGTSGALSGQGSTVAGDAARAGGATSHDTTGALQGPGSAVSGAAARTRQHGTSGALTGPGSEVSGAGVHNRLHLSSGALTGPGASLAGEASQTGDPVRPATVGLTVATPSKRAGAVSSGRRGPQVSSGTRVPQVSTGVR